MKKQKLLGFVVLLSGAALFSSCEKEKVKGCTDSVSYSYSSDAEEDDGSCKYYYGGKNYGQLDVGAEIDLNNEYDIYIDNELIGRSMYYFPNGLSCGNPQAVGGIYPSGTHLVRAVGNGGSEVREESVRLDPQECKVILIEELKLK